MCTLIDSGGDQAVHAEAGYCSTEPLPVAGVAARQANIWLSSKTSHSAVVLPALMAMNELISKEMTK